MRVLQNNLKPATHFIEVYKIYQETFNSGTPCDIGFIDDAIKCTEELDDCKTIAIFKIRAKD
jgi:hypothetical protein